MNKLISWLKTLDNNLVQILLVSFFFVIPLYPKLPLKFIEYTYIYIRLDDFYLVFFVLIFLIQLIRKKVQLNTRFLKQIVVFWAAVFLSLLWGMYVSRNLHYHQVATLHALRRVEYMLVFFVAASAIKSARHFKIMLFSLFASLFLVDLYGLGQRFFGFPAIQTMNPAFAKGILLFLTPEARISSTFGGHYDFSAYLVLMIPLVLGYFLGLKKEALIKKILYFFLSILSIFLLTLTASRTSFIAYIFSTPLLFLWFRKYRFFIFILILSLTMGIFSRDLTSRFKSTVQMKHFLVNEKTGAIKVVQEITTKNLPAGTAILKVKEDNGVSQETTESKAMKENIINEATASGELTAKEIATLSSQIKTISATTVDISTATRLQVEWPRAIAAWKKNPILGTGPSSITESTDNDYLRWLGEFGSLGFITFLFILFSLFRFILKNLNNVPENYKPFFMATIIALFGLLINAFYIDVFEASKVAYIFWATYGICVGFLSLKKYG